MSASDLHQSLQRRLATLLGGALLVVAMLLAGTLSYFTSLTQWQVWFGLGSSALVVATPTLWLISRMLRQYTHQLTASQEVVLEGQSPLDNVAQPFGSRPAPEQTVVRETTSPEIEATRRELARLRQVESMLTRRNRELTIMQAAGMAMTSSLDRRYVLDTVVEQMTQLVGVECCSLFEWDQAEGTIERVARYDGGGWLSVESLPLSRRLIDYPVIRTVIEEQIPEQMTLSQSGLDPAEAAYMQEASLKTRLMLPMIFQQRVVGLVELEDRQIERTFTSQELSLVKLLANQAGSAIENARLYQQAQQEIDERQRAEAALEAERALLAERVKERTAALSEANAQLARAARLKDEFLANMSHELRTPLNVIIGSSELLGQEIFGELSEKQQRYVNNIHESGEHLLSLITDILDLSKIEAGRLELERRSISVESVCEASMRLVKQLAHKKKLRVAMNIDEKIEAMSADERRLKQILVNLMSNAIKFTPVEGQIGLDVEADAAQNAVKFTVWDTGIGIAKEDLETLFQPFIQVDSTLAREQEGTGLGLSLVARLTELHGGSVSVESEIGTGSRFTIALPWSPSLDNDQNGDTTTGADFTPAPSSPNKPVTADSPLILIAEDNKKNVEMILDFLEAQGYRLTLAENGQEAIERTRAEKPDLILMDVQMPGIDGVEATRRLRADAELAEVPIIALTALAMPDDRERCLRAGMNDYLSKPLSPTTLIDTIHSYLKTNHK